MILLMLDSLEEYNYTFNDGLLSINKLPLIITPKDTTLNYGEKLGSFNYNLIILIH